MDYLTAAEVARIYKISLNHVYVLACTNKWGRYRGPDRRIRYRLHDVAKTMEPKNATTP